MKKFKKLMQRNVEMAQKQYILWIFALSKMKWQEFATNFQHHYKRPEVQSNFPGPWQPPKPTQSRSGP